MSEEKSRIKAIINQKEYVIVGNESRGHMQATAKMVDEQIQQLLTLSPELTAEQAAVLVAINAVSDQLKMKAEIEKSEQSI